MKKLMLLTAMLITLQGFALSMGDEAVELDSKFYNGKVFKAKFYMVDEKNQKKLKVLVFARLLANDFLYSEAVLDEISENKAVSAAVIGSSEQEVQTFLKMKPDFKLPLLFDKEAHKTYMDKNIIYPRAFVVNYENKIIWDGELIDLPQMLEKFEDGTYDMEKNRKINLHLAEMQNALRGGSEYQFDRAARAILAIDPGNLACLRMRMFYFENTNRMDEAWKFLEEFRRKNMQEKNLYLLQIDMGARYAAFSKKGSAVGKEFISAKLGSNSDRLLAAWLFLDRYAFNIEALECGETLLGALNEEMFKGNPAELAVFFRANALASFKRGDTDTAIAKQQKACAVIDNEENRMILEYYEKIRKK